jgi:hypothetical protein
MRNKGLQPHSVLTVNGRVEINRRRWHCPGVGSITPVDKLVEISEATVSLGVRELCGRLNANASNFERAAENLYRAAQVRISGELLRQVVEAEGKQVLAKVREGKLLPGWRAPECRTPKGVSRVYMGVDGVMAPVVTQAEKDKRRKQVRQKRQRRGRKAKPLPSPKRGADQAYKEFKIVTFYDQDMRHRLVSTTQGNHEAAGRLMRRDARRLGLREAQEKVGNVDGASWIRNQIQHQRLGLTALGLDFYHLSENVHKARRAVYGEDDAAGKSWAESVLHEVKHEGYDRLWGHLAEWRNRWRNPAKRKAADQLLHYVSERREMIRYPEFLANGWQIGSGPTESMCKVIPRRVKGVGMRWDRDNAEAIMALEGLEQGHQWSQYWATCLHSMN